MLLLLLLPWLLVLLFQMWKKQVRQTCRQLQQHLYYSENAQMPGLCIYVSPFLDWYLQLAADRLPLAACDL